MIVIFAGNIGASHVSQRLPSAFLATVCYALCVAGSHALSSGQATACGVETDRGLLEMVPAVPKHAFSSVVF